MREIAFDVAGIPRPQGSKVCHCSGQHGPGQLWESSKELGPWRTKIRKQAKARRHLVTWVRATPLAVELTFVMPKPLDRDVGWYPNMPDIDKLERAVLDALQQGGVLFDDAQVVMVIKRKLCGWHPGVSIRVCDAPYSYHSAVTPVTLFEGASSD